MPIDRMDAFDVVTDRELNAKTSNLKRNMALKMAIQRVRSQWFSYEEPSELYADLKSGRFDPAKIAYETLLEVLGSVDAKTLEILRDIGVGSPQMGIAGFGIPNQQPTQEKQEGL